MLDIGCGTGRFAKGVDDLTGPGTRALSFAVKTIGRKVISWAARRTPTHQDYRYRAPTDLQVAQTTPLRFLLIGSCFLHSIQHVLKDMGHSADLIVSNNVAALPLKTSGEIGRYDLQVVQIPFRSLVSDSTFMTLPWGDPKSHQDHFDAACVRLAQSLDASLAYNRQCGITTAVVNFLCPQQNPLGRLLPRYDIRNPVYFVEQLNTALSEILSRETDVYVLDADQVSATYGRMYHQDDHVWSNTHGGTLGDFDAAFDRERIQPVTPMDRIYQSRVIEFLKACCNELEGLYRTVRQIDQVKLVVIDLDDTLWRGVAAEQGHIGETEGWPLGFLEALAQLQTRGILLGIISKNDQQRVEVLWTQYLAPRLRINTFAVRKINWASKTDNMVEILKETNLLPHSVVFIDDNPVERASMEAAYPEMRVLGSEPYLLRRILLWAPETQVGHITAESTLRTAMIEVEGHRREERLRLPRADFLASLAIGIRVILIERTGHDAFKRAAELLNKTNQFNTTGRRWSSTDLRCLLDAGGKLHAFEVQDRFSLHGIVGLVITQGNTIEQVVMSCRIIGMDIELAMLDMVCQTLRASGPTRVCATVKATESNEITRDLFDRAGFMQLGEGWRLEPEADVGSVPHIAFIS